MPESILPDQTILLLGATGKIGLEIRKAMNAVASKVHLICVSRKPHLGPEFPHETWLQFDPLEENWPEMEEVDVLINAVGIIRERNGMGFEQVHQGLTARILAQRGRLGMPRIVQVSALGASVDAESAFLRSKGLADAALMLHPNVVVLRPSIVCTPDTMLSQKLRKLLKIGRFAFGKLLVPAGFPATQIQPILGADVGYAVARAARAPVVLPLYELVGPARISFGKLIETMAAAQKRNIRLLEVSREIMDSFVKHFVGVWFPDLISIAQFRLLFEDNVGDLDQTTQLIGRMPTSTLQFWKAEANCVQTQDDPIEAEFEHRHVAPSEIKSNPSYSDL